MHNTKQQKQINQIALLLGLLPKSLMEKQFKKVWAKKTKCLDEPKKNIKEIEALQTEQTKKIMYEQKPVYNWLEELKYNTLQTNKHKKFIEYYKTEYYKISLQDLGIFKEEK